MFLIASPFGLGHLPAEEGIVLALPAESAVAEKAGNFFGPQAESASYI
jgi:hypothetical protein